MSDRLIVEVLGGYCAAGACFWGWYTHRALRWFLNHPKAEEYWGSKRDDSLSAYTGRLVSSLFFWPLLAAAWAFQELSLIEPVAVLEEKAARKAEGREALPAETD